MTTAEMTPRTYADLLALVDCAPVVTAGGACAAPAAPAPGAAKTSAPAGQETPAPQAGGVGGSSEASSAVGAPAVPDASNATGPTIPGPSTPPLARDIDTFQEREILEAIQLVVLGTVGDAKVKIFSQYHRATRIVSDVSRLKYENLLQLCGPPARTRIRDTPTSDDMPSGVYSLKDVKRAIALVAGYRTITEGGEVGSGVWSGLNDDGKPHDSVVIVGNSEAADWNGDKTLRKIEQPLARGRLLNFDQQKTNWYEFRDLSLLMQQASDPEFRVRAMRDCIILFNRWRWKQQTATPIILTGLAFASWVQTLWEWRPLVSVIGPTSSGKSMFCKTVKGLFGNLGKSCSDLTAAGFRQMVESSARAFFLDEFDAKDKFQAMEQQKILKMLRTAGRGDGIVRGQASQKAIEVHLQHIVWLLGIQIASPDQADRNRFITGELMPPTEELRGKLVVPEQQELIDLGQRMLATAIYCIHDARRLAVKIKDTRVPGVDDRVVESHSVPAAMLAVIQGQNEEDARETLREMLLPLAVDEPAGGSDEQSLMADILGARVQDGATRLAVSQMVENVIRQGPRSDIHSETLESVGVKIDHFMLANKCKGAACFLIAYNAVAEHLLKNTRWGSQAIDQILRRIPGAVASRRRVAKQRVLTVAIPLEMFCKEFLDLDVGLPGMDVAGGGGEF